MSTVSKQQRQTYPPPPSPFPSLPLQFKLLVYAAQNVYKATALIKPTFKFTIQSGNYASFYDDQRTAWSLHFDSVSDQVGVAKQVAICRANAGDISNVIIQDLVLGEGQVGVVEGRGRWVWSARGAQWCVCACVAVCCRVLPRETLWRPSTLATCSRTVPWAR